MALKNKLEDGAGLLRGLAGLVVGVVGVIPTPLLLTVDASRRLRYLNRPENIMYNQSKPSPNTEDFPVGLPEEITPKYLKGLSDLVYSINGELRA